MTSVTKKLKKKSEFQREKIVGLITLRERENYLGFHLVLILS